MTKSKRVRKPTRLLTKNLLHKKKVFAKAVAAGKPMGVAARIAGYTNSPNQRASEMALDQDVQSEIAAAQKTAIDYMQIDVNVYFEQLHAIATADLADILDPKTGLVLPLHQMPAKARMALASLDMVTQNLTTGDGKVDFVLKPRYYDKINALVTMLKAHGKLVSKVERGRPGEFDRLSREELRKVIEQELAPAAGLRLVSSK